MARFLWICLGGAAGTGARYLLSLAMLRLAGPAFPWGTLLVNVLGSFLLGLILEAQISTGWLSPTWNLALTTGVLGGFTTYSTFNYETLRLLQAGAWWLGIANLLGTVLGCLAAGALGFAFARWLVGS
ncbi:MAG TPA: fluoride efflux transporter CrcB [Thermoanaerobaculia bacterium]|nr:fluoride efflux transporter CrcB [bacterium]HYG64645.1 fluoride efflux transporter CrcB [Thermoanaerobaculia bacterium]